MSRTWENRNRRSVPLRHTINFVPVRCLTGHRRLEWQLHTCKSSALDRVKLSD